MQQTQSESSKREIVITGFGGQGIVLAGRILGQAASLGDHRQSTLIQSYGPESRGGACSAQVIVAEKEIHYPYVRSVDVLACMSQSGFEKFIGHVKAEGIVLIDQDLVRPKKAVTDFFGIPSTRMAEELGHKMMANIIMLGFFTAITGVVSVDAMLDAVGASVPTGTEEKNATAFRKGYDYGHSVLKGRRQKAAGKTGACL